MDVGIEHKLPFDGIARGSFQDNFDFLRELKPQDTTLLAVVMMVL